MSTKDSLGSLFLRFRAIDNQSRRADYTADGDRDHELIVGNRLQFSRAASFNDPFEARPFFSWSRDGVPTVEEIERTVRAKEPQASEQDVRKLVLVGLREFEDSGVREAYKQVSLHRHRETFRANPMACFSAGSAVQEILLWAHYADSCRGYAACFDFSVPWVHDITLNGERRSVSLRPIEVHYRPDYPVIDGDADFEDPSVRDETTRAALLAKSDRWTYECEHRVILVAQEPGSRAYPSAMLRAIVLGPAISDDDAQKIVALAEASPSKPQVIRSRLHDSRYELILDGG